MSFLGSKNSIFVGFAIIILGFVFKEQIVSSAGNNAFYIVILIGLGLSAYGVYRQMSENSEDNHLSEEELRNKVILHTLARMTNADSNVMQVEVESVRATYKSITGDDITSKDIRVAALGELFEDKPFQSYLKKAEDRISIDSKKKIMKALSTIMESDGVVNPQEVEFFNTVAKCLNLEAAELLDI